MYKQLTGSLLLALSMSSVGLSQSIKDVSFLGPGCDFRSAKANGSKAIDGLELSFSKLVLSKKEVASKTAVFCKVQVLVQNEKGKAFRFKSLNIGLSSEGQETISGELYVSLYDGKVYRDSNPRKVILSTDSLPKTVKLEQLGVGPQQRYCSGDLVPYQIVLAFIPSGSLGQDSINGLISLDKISDIVFETSDC